MATVTGLTATRMLEIEGASVVDGEVVGDDLILTQHNGSTINAGNVRGPAGFSESGLLSRAENTTGDALVLSTTTNDNPGCVVMVPPTDREVEIEWCAGIAVTVGGQGAVVGQIYEITDGVAVFRGGDRTPFNSNQSNTVNGPMNKGKVLVGKADHTRMFALYGQLVQEGSSLAAAFQNLTTSPTWIKAVAL